MTPVSQNFIHRDIKRLEQLAPKSESALDNPELLFEATKFDDVELNQSEDLEKNIENFFMFKL